LRKQYKIAVSEKDAHYRAKLIASLHEMDRDLQIMRFNVKNSRKYLPIRAEQVLEDIDNAFIDLETTQGILNLLDIQYGYEPEGIEEYLRKKCPAKK
jgi:hypothetical protein